MEAIKAAGSLLLGLVFVAALVFIAALFIVGTAKVSEIALPFLTIASVIGVIICVVILLPLSIFRFTRIVSVWGFFIASYLFGAYVWMYGFFVTYNLWGAGGLLAGLFLGVVGVVPLGIIAAAFNGLWSIAAELAVLLVFTFGARMFALFLATSLDRAAIEA